MSSWKLEDVLKPIFGTNWNKLSSNVFWIYGAIKPNDKERLEREIIAYWIDWLSQLKVEVICKNLHENILTQVRSSEYNRFFDGDKIHVISDSDTTTVATIKEILIILQTVIDIFEELNRLDLDPSKPMTADLIARVSNLLTQIHPLFMALKSLSHSIISVEATIAPLLQPVFQLIENAPEKLNQTKKYALDVQDDNQEALKNMVSSQHSGLHLLSRGIVISPYVFQELTELVERGDTKIDFDPLDPLIIDMETRFKQKLESIQKATHSNPLDEALYWKNLVSLLGLLLTELNHILKKGAPLTAASHKRALELLDQIHYKTLPYLQGELERLEEHTGLKDRFVKPFLTSVTQWYTTTVDKINQLKTLSETLSDTHDLLAKPVVHLFKKSTKAKSTSELSSIGDEQYSKQTTLIRQKRHANYIAHQEQLKGPILQAAIKFFDKINKPPLNEKTKAELSALYQKIQPYLVKKFPKLDIQIVQGLQYEWDFYAMPLSDTERYIAQNNLNTSHYFSLDEEGTNVIFIRKNEQYEILTLDLSEKKWQPLINLEQEAVNAKRPKDHLILRAKDIDQLFSHKMSSPTLDLSQISQCEKTVLNEIKLAANQEAFHAQQIGEQSPQATLSQARKDLADLEEKQKTNPLKPLGAEFYHQDLFGRIHELKLSEKLDDFEQHALAPWIKNLVTETTWNAIGYDRTIINKAKYTDQSQVVPHKRIFSLMFQLKTCLKELERIEALENDPLNEWAYADGIQSTIGRLVTYFTQASPKEAKYIQGILFPILKEGIGAYFELLELINNPIYQDLKQQLLDTLKPLKEFEFVLKFFNLSAHKPSQKPEPIAPINNNLFETWQMAESQREDRLLKRAPKKLSPSPKEATLPPDTTISAPPLPNIRDLVTWINQESIELIEYQKKLNKQESVTERPEDRTTQFFQAIKDKSNEILKRTTKVPEGHDTWVDHAAALSIDGQFFELGDLTILQFLQNSLSFVQNISTIISELTTENKQEIFSTLKILHHVIQYKILSLLDDAEIKLGLEPGILNKKYQFTALLDNAFDKLLIPKAQTGEALKPFIDFFADETVTQWRSRRTQDQFQLLWEGAEAFEKQKNKTQTETNNALTELQTLKENLQPYSKNKNWSFENTELLRETFCSCYDQINPLLKQIDPGLYTRDSVFFDLITTPAQLITQIDAILKLKPELDRLMQTQKEDYVARLERVKKHLNYLEQTQPQETQIKLLENIIQKLLEQHYDFKNYTPLFIQTVTPVILKQIQGKPELLSYLLNNIKLKNIDTLENDLTAEIYTAFIHHKNTINKLMTTLTKLSDAESRRQKQYRTTLEKLSHEKIEYTLDLYPGKKQYLSPNKIYIERITTENEPFYKIKYHVQKNEGYLKESELKNLSISLSSPYKLTKKIIQKQFTPKLKEIIKITHKNNHTRPKNPCLHELMHYMEKINPDETQASRLTELFQNQGYEIDVSPDNKDLKDDQCTQNTLFLSLNDRKELNYCVRYQGTIIKDSFDRATLKKLNLSNLSNPLSDKEIRKQLQKALPDILKLTEQRKHTTTFIQDPGRRTHFYKRLYLSHSVILKASHQFRQKRIDTLENMIKIYNILNNLEIHVLKQIRPHPEKLEMICALKNCLADTKKTPHQRMDILLQYFNHQQNKDAFTTSSDSFIARCFKKIITLMTCRPLKEESFIDALGIELRKHSKQSPTLTFSFFGKPPIVFEKLLNQAPKPPRI
jgi:hypothetical protein